jgi:hypothetical protein
MSKRSVVTLALLLFSANLTFVFAQNLTPDDILARHLESIGTKEKRQALTSLMAAGTSVFESKMPSVKGGGKAVVVSDTGNLYYLMSLNSREYPFEKIGMFGNKASLPFVTAGTRSLLGSFLNEHPQVLTDSLFCGSISLMWINNVAEMRKLDLRSAGKKKVDGLQTMTLDVISTTKGSDDFKIRLFFDAETFRHVRTEYRREFKIGRIVMGQQNQLADSRLNLTEEFSDFKDVTGYTLPHHYKVTFSSNSNAQMNETSWSISVNSYYLNPKLAHDFFTFEVKN